jgi:hypothetical protein
VHKKEIVHVAIDNQFIMPVLLCMYRAKNRGMHKEIVQLRATATLQQNSPSEEGRDTWSGSLFLGFLRPPNADT